MSSHYPKLEYIVGKASSAERSRSMITGVVTQMVQQGLMWKKCFVFLYTRKQARNIAEISFVAETQVFSCFIFSLNEHKLAYFNGILNV